jgi:hypothetical protein
MFFLLLASWVTLIANQELGSVKPQIVNDSDYSQVLYSACEGGDPLECDAFALTCYFNENELTFEIFSDRAPQVAEAMTRNNGEEASGEFSLAFGVVSVRSPVSGIHLTKDREAEKWSLALGLSNSHVLFDILSDKTAGEAKFTVAGFEYPLAPTGEAHPLMMLKQSCIEGSAYFQD